MQEIGNLAWAVAPGESEITIDHVRQIMPAAKDAMNSSVHAPIYNSLAPKLREALLVIAKNPGIRSGELAERLGVPATGISGIQQRLVAAGVLLRVARGLVRISIPYLQQYLAAIVEAGGASDKTQLDILDGYPDVDL